MNLLFLRPLAIPAAWLAAAFALSACGGTATAPPPSEVHIPVQPIGAAPAPPSLELTPAATKTLRFSWADVAGETSYRLLEDPDGASGYSPLATLAADSTQYTLEGVFLPERLQARYILQACNSAGCADSPLVSVGDALFQATGYLKAPQLGQSAHLGTSLAVSADGRTLAVGAPDEHGANTGLVCVYARQASDWLQQACFNAANADTNDAFGTSLALSGDGRTLAVGAPGEDSISADPLDNSGSNNGAVYVFTRQGAAWQASAYLKAPVSDPNDRFGDSLALSADGLTLAVGAPVEDSASSDPLDNSGSDNGAVYVFTGEGGQWTFQSYLKASNVDFYDLFGTSLALSADGRTLAVGAPGERSRSGDPLDNGGDGNGAAYVFTRQGSAWSQQSYLKAAQSALRDRFGSSLALSADGSTLAVGAPGEPRTQIDGTVYLFSHQGGAWQQAALKPTHSDPQDRFGASLSLSADGLSLAVGAPGEDSTGRDPNDNSGTDHGAAYLFVHRAGGWQQQAYLKAFNTDAHDEFGSSTALSADGQTLAIGAVNEGSAADPADNGAFQSGAVYLY